jgi:RAQPRD family integrative conjugative element protein
MQTRSAIGRRDLLVAAVVTLGASLSGPASADIDAERTRLAMLLRQLDLLETLVRQAEDSAPTSARYHFDFARLRADLARIRRGIEDYLTPRRAQPRDPVELSGDYQRQESHS